MGYKQWQSPGLIVIVVALLLATPLAYGQLLPDSRLDIIGRLCCTPNGNCSPGSEGIQGVAVRLNCTPILSAVGPAVTAFTGLNGVLSLTTPILGTTLGPVVNGMSTCNVVVGLPLNSTECPILSNTTGTLTSTISLVRTFGTGLLGLVAVFVADAFRVVTNNV